MTEYQLSEDDFNYIKDLAKECWLHTQKGSIICTIESFLHFLGSKNLIVKNGAIYEQE